MIMPAASRRNPCNGTASRHLPPNIGGMYIRAAPDRRQRPCPLLPSRHPWLFLLAPVTLRHMINRRSFLKVTVGAAALTALGPHGYCAAPKRKLRKAIMYSTIGVKGSVLEKFRAMKEAGFEGVEAMGGMKREEVIAAYKETGLQAASVCCHTHWDKPLSAPDEATRKVGLDGLVTSLHDAKAYGAGSVLLVPGVARDGVTYQECFDRSIAEIRKAIPVAKETGVKISIENVGNNFIMKPEQAVEYLDAINSE